MLTPVDNVAYWAQALDFDGSLMFGSTSMWIPASGELDARVNIDALETPPGECALQEAGGCLCEARRHETSARRMESWCEGRLRCERIEGRGQNQVSTELSHGHATTRARPTCAPPPPRGGSAPRRRPPAISRGAAGEATSADEGTATTHGRTRTEQQRRRGYGGASVCETSMGNESKPLLDAGHTSCTPRHNYADPSPGSDGYDAPDAPREGHQTPMRLRASPWGPTTSRK